MYLKSLVFLLFAIKIMSNSALAMKSTTTKTIDTKTSSIPKSFRALVAKHVGTSFSDVSTIIDIDTPTELKNDEVLIRVEYAGINGGCETFRARAEYDFQGNKDETNFPLGAEGVGRVVAVGSDVNNVAVGDAVCFVGSAFAEYSIGKANFLWKIPNVKPEYVGLRISALTSFAMLEHTGKIKEGEKVLITAAAGGAGHFAVQVAKLAGCEVIGTCGSDEKAKVLESLGCDHIINYKTQNVKEELNRIAPDGLDAVLEGVGGSMLKVALECLAPEGKLLQIGYISEYPHSDDDNTENANADLNVADLFWKRQTITRGKQTIIGNAWPKDMSALAGCEKRILDLYAEGKLQSIVDESKFVGLESVNDAINHMLSGKTYGKVVAKIQ